MSGPHFQRVFSRWVGVSPKRYQQYLALDHAKALLRDRFTTLDTADAVGLSGGGRLHDLFLRWEAMSPGELCPRRRRADDRLGLVRQPFGPALAMGTDRGLCGLGFCRRDRHRGDLDDLAARWPKADIRRGSGRAGSLGRCGAWPCRARRGCT